MQLFHQKVYVSQYHQQEWIYDVMLDAKLKVVQVHVYKELHRNNIVLMYKQVRIRLVHEDNLVVKQTNMLTPTINTCIYIYIYIYNLSSTNSL